MLSLKRLGLFPFASIGVTSYKRLLLPEVSVYASQDDDSRNSTPIINTNKEQKAAANNLPALIEKERPIPYANHQHILC